MGTRKNGRARRRRVSPSRAPVLSFARYFQAPATQATFPATIVLLYPLLDSIRESAKCFQFFLNKHYMQVAKSSTIPSANDVIDLCWILHDKPRIFATFFFQPRNAFELFFIVPSLQISCFRKTKARKTVRLKISVSRPDLFDS